MGTEFDKQAPDNTFIIPPSDVDCSLNSLPACQDKLIIPAESDVFYVTQRSRKH